MAIAIKMVDIPCINMLISWKFIVAIKIGGGVGATEGIGPGNFGGGELP